MNSLITIEDNKKFEETRKYLSNIVNEPYKRKTPPKYISKKGEFDYVHFEYMLAEMNELHPLRRETVTHESYDQTSYTFFFTVMVEDLVTKEARCGSDAHPVIAYESGSNTLKPARTIRELLGNARKAALTKALRNAYSNFGISSDIYKIQIDEPATPEQRQKLIDQLSRVGNCEFASIEKKEAADKWVQDRLFYFDSNVSKEEADSYISNIIPKINHIIEKGTQDDDRAS